MSALRDTVEALFSSELADRLYDEVVTEREHALQAASLAATAGASNALVAAALLHDIGHLLVGDYFPIDQALPRDFHHEQAGANRLRRWFPDEVTEPVRLHVEAKRYLVATDTHYLAELSPSSVRSLAIQGGPMSAQEATDFARLPAAQDAIALRGWDDEAKVAGLEVEPLSTYLPMLDSLRHRP